MARKNPTNDESVLENEFLNDEETEQKQGDPVQQSPIVTEEGCVQQVANDLGEREPDRGAQDKRHHGEREAPSIGANPRPQPAKLGWGRKSPGGLLAPISAHGRSEISVLEPRPSRVCPVLDGSE